MAFGHSMITFGSLLSPIGLVIAALVVGGILIQRHWEPLGAFFEGFAKGFNTTVGPALTPVVEVLKRAACIGNSFDMKMLARVYGKPLEETQRQFAPALEEGLMKPLDGYRRQAGTGGPADEETARYRFLHDRVQQAAYSLISETERKPVHLQIGRQLLEGISGEDLPEQVFSIVGQLNLGVELIES